MKEARRPTYIRAWRKYRDNMSQARLAERLEVEADYLISVPQLSRIETGEQPYNQDLLEALATVLRCSPADLLMRDPTATEAPWTIWETLEPVEQRQAVEIMKALKRTGSDG